MNVMGLFDISYYYNEEDDVEIYEYRANPTTKLALKNDILAGRNE
jgi:hypothetical protein